MGRSAAPEDPPTARIDNRRDARSQARATASRASFAGMLRRFHSSPVILRAAIARSDVTHHCGLAAAVSAAAVSAPSVPTGGSCAACNVSRNATSDSTSAGRVACRRPACCRPLESPAESTRSLRQPIGDTRQVRPTASAHAVQRVAIAARLVLKDGRPLQFQRRRAPRSSRSGPASPLQASICGDQGDRFPKYAKHAVRDRKNHHDQHRHRPPPWDCVPPCRRRTATTPGSQSPTTGRTSIIAVSISGGREGQQRKQRQEVPIGAGLGRDRSSDPGARRDLWDRSNGQRRTRPARAARKRSRLRLTSFGKNGSPAFNSAAYSA